MSFSNIVTTNSQITNIETFLNNKNVALVSPKTSPGISGFIFDIPQKDHVSLSADITDNYTEDNSFINDHRVIKPVTINLSGLIGELVVKAEFLDMLLETLQSALTTVSAFLGNYTDGMDQKIQEIFSTTRLAVSQTTQSINRVKNIVEGFDGEGPFENLQQKAFNNLEALFRSETVLTVQTPWKYYDSVMIESLEFMQEESESFSDISVVLKEMRFAKIGVTTYQGNLNANRNELQSKETKDTGRVKGVRNSLIYDATDVAGGKF